MIGAAIPKIPARQLRAAPARLDDLTAVVVKRLRES
jgi:hypothetical protein